MLYLTHNYDSNVIFKGIPIVSVMRNSPADTANVSTRVGPVPIQIATYNADVARRYSAITEIYREKDR